MAKGLDNKQKCVIDGLLLSDGHLSISGKNARISFTLKYVGFAEAITESLPALNWSPIRAYKYSDNRTGNTYTQIKLRSRTSSYLTEQHSRWYPNGRKVVPSDLCLSITTLLWWYLGDGHLERKKSRPNYRRVCLSTDSFSEVESTMLQEKLVKLLGSDTSIYLETGRIMIGRNALCAFAKKIVDKNPVPEYDYKFDFGQYLDNSYLEKSYAKRPLAKINAYRKIHKVREFDFELLEV